MSKLGIGVGIPPAPFVYTLDMRDEIITTSEQLREAMYRFREKHLERISTIFISPTQEYCVRADIVPSLYNVKENREYRVEEIGQLQEFMGYRVIVKSEVS